MASDFYVPKWDTFGAADTAIPKPAHHSLLGNLLRDVVEIPKGIIPGMVATVKHPIRVGKMIVDSEKQMYSPLFHGHWDKFYGNLHAHPLTPILDAVSVLTLAFGGVGAGIKGADVAVNMGREVRAAAAAAAVRSGGDATAMTMGKTGADWASLYDNAIQATGYDKVKALSDIRVGVSKTPRLTKLAENFRRGAPATMKDLPTGMEGLHAYKNYSANLFTRAMQRYMYEPVFSGLAKIPKSPLGEGGIYDYTAAGRAKRFISKGESERKAALGELRRRQVKSFRNVHKKLVKEGMPEQAIHENLKHFIGLLVDETDKRVAATGVRVAVHEASDVPDHIPYRYEKDISRQRVPKGGIIYPHGAGVSGGAMSSAKSVVYQQLEGGTKKMRLPIRGSQKGKYSISFPQKATKVVVRSGKGRKYVPVKWDHEKGMEAAVAEWTKDLGSRYGGENLTRAVKDAKVYTDPATGQQYYNMLHEGAGSGAVSALTEEAQRTAKTMRLIGTKPITAWKYAVLSFSPRYFMNNMSNYLMYAMSANPVATTRGILDSIRINKGHKAALAAAHTMEDVLDNEAKKYSGTWFDQHFHGIHASNYGSGIDSGQFFSGKGLKHAAGFGFRAVEKGIYEPSMRWGTITAMRSIPAVRRLELLFRAEGMTDLEAFNAAAAHFASDPAMHAVVMNMVGNWAGQYYHLNSLEQKLMAVVPFYNWDRHALRFARSTLVEHPTTAAVLAKEGQIGNEENVKALGDLPDFMKTAVPIGQLPGLAGKIEDVVLGSQQVGRKKILLTTGQNPYAAAGEVIHAAAGLVGAYEGGPAAASQMSPLFTGIMAGITGQNPVSGAKVKPGFHGQGGIMGTVFSSIATTPAPVKVIGGALAEAGLPIGGFPKPKPDKRTGVTKPFLYQKREATTVRNWIGIDVKDFDQKAAKALSDKEHGIKSPPKDNTKFILPALRKQSSHHSSTSGFRVRKKRTSSHKITAHSHISFPRVQKKGLKGIGGIGGI